MKALIIIACLFLVGCGEKEIETRTEYISTKEIGRAYIYFCKSYRGCSRQWHWISIIEGNQEHNEQAIILSRNDATAKLRFYTSPAPGGRSVEIDIPNELIYLYEKEKETKKIEKNTERRQTKLEEYFKNNSISLELDIRKMHQYGSEVDVCFGIKEKEMK